MKILILLKLYLEFINVYNKIYKFVMIEGAPRNPYQ